MNMETTDEKLGAYMDGELSADEAAALEQELAKDADLQARLDALLATNKAASTLFAELDKQPMPEAVLKMLQEEPASQEPARPDNVVPFLKLGAGRFFNMPVAIAASVALVVSFLVVDLSRQTSGAMTSIEALSAGSIDTDSALQQMLDESRSGERVILGNDETGEAILSFADSSSRFCRQLQVVSAESVAHAIACRTENNWELEAVAVTDPAPGGQFQPAGTTTPVNIISAVDGLIGDADPLGPDEETRAISNSWKKSD